MTDLPGTAHSFFMQVTHYEEEKPASITSILGLNMGRVVERKHDT